MKHEIKIPQVGESITEATIESWMKKNGEAIKRDDVLLNLETDKATVEVVAENDGVLEISVSEGETIDIGAVVGFIDSEASAQTSAPTIEDTPPPPTAETNAPIAATPAPATAAPAASSGSGEIFAVNVPQVGESITEATVGDWMKENGATVERDDVLLSLETDKASVDVVAEKSGVLEIVAKEGETVQIGGLLANIQVGASSGASAASPAVSIPSSSPSLPDAAPVMPMNAPDMASLNELSPAVRSIVAENNLNPSAITGTGKDGRITKADAMASIGSSATAAQLEPNKVENSTVAIPKSSPKPSAPAASASGSEDFPTRRVKMTTIRRKIAERLLEAQQNAAILTTFNEIDMSRVMAMRTKYKDQFKERHGTGLGFMGFFTKACVEALKMVPEVNGQIDKDHVIYHDYANIGIAVGSEKGLVVPVLKNVQNMNIAQIESSIRAYAAKARDGKISIADLSGGTFTISNGGTYGSLMSTPILNPPQSAILGMHKIEERPIVVEGKIEIRPMMYVALSYDHRIIDGQGAVTFLVKVKEFIENPERILLEI